FFFRPRGCSSCSCVWLGRCCVLVSVHYYIDPEEALGSTNEIFTGRFLFMEANIAEMNTEM
ncbi:hypothetical protein NPM08_33320, partial [Bacillus cereus]|uniref:hypothetical protein n=1 Tax=Bacillus cereus TaxID=1396 RepID=UPI00211208FC